MTEKEFLNLANDIGCSFNQISPYEVSVSISNDVETVEFLTDRDNVVDACKVMVEYANDYNVEEVISDELSNCDLPTVYINISYLREQTTIIKDKLNELKVLILNFLEEE